jgi:hypothetical protein
LESEIQEPLANKQHHVAISFDLGKAYDTAWRYNIIRTLWNLEMKGNMLFFISNFIRNRRFCVLIGNILSDVHSQANGILSLNLQSTKQRIYMNTLVFIFKIKNNMAPDYLTSKILYTREATTR